MNQDNSNDTSNAGGSWASVARKSNVKKQPLVAFSYSSQQRYREQSPQVDQNHDSRFDSIVFTKQKTPTVARQQATQTGGKNKQMQSDVDLRKIERGEIRLPTSNRELAQKIQQYRSAKKWTQDEFNRLCAFPANTIKNYENCSAVAQQQQIDVMKRVLGVNDLHKPPTIKLKSDEAK